MVMYPEEIIVRNNCAGEDQQQFNQSTKIAELAKQGSPYHWKISKLHMAFQVQYIYD
jgi:hypothetical protein